MATRAEVDSSINALIVPTITPPIHREANKQILDYVDQLGAAVINNNVAFVEIGGNNSTAILGQANSPFLTLQAALAALPSSGGLILVGIGDFVAPPLSSWKSNVTVRGLMKPRFNGTASQTGTTTTTMTAPTRLIDGTVIKGNVAIIDLENCKFYNLGIDCGPDYVTGGGTESNCLGHGLTSSGNDSLTPPFAMKTGFVANGLVLLGKNPSSAFHCLVLENVLDAVVEDVATCYSVHGIAFKGVGGSVQNVRCYAHSSDGIIIKRNNYAPNARVIVSDFFINALSGVGGGLIVENAGGTNDGNISISNGIIYGTTFGAKDQTGGTQEVFISHVQVKSCGAGFVFSTLSKSKISDCLASGCTGPGFNIGGTNVVLIGNMSIGNSTYGYNVIGSGVYGANNFASGNTTATINGAFQTITL
jgi:hypothetical protein